MAAAGLLPTTAFGHAPDDAVQQAPGLASAFTLDPLLLAPLVLLATLQIVALRRLPRGGAWPRLAPVLGWVGLLAALVFPLDRLGEWLFSAHMAQHMLLMAFVPPLLLVGVAPAHLLHGFPTGMRRPLGRVLHWIAEPSRFGSATALALASALQALTMWGWHWPPLLQAALADDLLHYTMHASFLASGLLFWWCLLLSLRAPATGFMPGIAAIVAAMMQMGLIGALLTFSPRVLVPWYAGRAEQYGLSALEDQQLAGLLMWVPASLPYLMGGLWLLYRWLGRLERHGRLAR